MVWKYIVLISLITVTSCYTTYSLYESKIIYSPEYIKAKTFWDINKALINPDQVESLNLLVDKNGYNYELFRKNFQKFKNLRKLVIDNTYSQIKLKNIDDFSLFKNLEHLSIQTFNNIETTRFNTLSELKYLALSGCRLKSFPTELLKLEKLEVLDLSINCLTNLPDSLFNLKKLVELDISNNSFNSIPSQIKHISTLRYFDFNNAETAEGYWDGTKFCKNTLIEYPKILTELQHLKKISLYRVEISDSLKVRISNNSGNIKINF